jgi:hypothetical protein
MLTTSTPEQVTSIIIGTGQISQLESESEVAFTTAPPLPSSISQVSDGESQPPTQLNSAQTTIESITSINSKLSKRIQRTLALNVFIRWSHYVPHKYTCIHFISHQLHRTIHPFCRPRTQKPHKHWCHCRRCCRWPCSHWNRSSRPILYSPQTSQETERHFTSKRR